MINLNYYLRSSLIVDSRIFGLLSSGSIPVKETFVKESYILGQKFSIIQAFRSVLNPSTLSNAYLTMEWGHPSRLFHHFLTVLKAALLAESNIYKNICQPLTYLVVKCLINSSFNRMLKVLNDNVKQIDKCQTIIHTGSVK